jgi:predicted membrane channel-forming protein YqfA (hemolysin III family)
MLVVAVTLVAASTLHLSDHVHGRGSPFNSDHAGIAEAIIAAVLAFGALALGRWRARAVARVAVGFAIVGFGVGLNFTTRGGDAPDIAYHLTILPVLIAMFVSLTLRPRRRSDRSGTEVPSADLQRDREASARCE